tara:strand:+ start:71 stop:535 length:465 start_codon:yes stop_codon:yes gene_type:complete
MEILLIESVKSVKDFLLFFSVHFVMHPFGYILYEISNTIIKISLINFAFIDIYRQANFYLSGLFLIFLLQQFGSTIVSGIFDFIYRGFQGVDFMFNLKTILIKKYGWTESEFDFMWNERRDQLNRLKIKQNFNTEKMAQYIDEHYSDNFKSTFH